MAHAVAAPPGPAIPMQRSFDDMGAALVDTTFVVFDLETTGGSPDECAITEVGAVKVRAGEVVAEFNTLVNPLMPIPPAISSLTGITDAMVATAPPIEEVLASFVEFIGGTTLVAHNAGFDTRFLGAALREHGYPPAENPVLCTVKLARRLVRDEVPNLQLSTLAHALRARTRPTHRALDDARATTDVFHALLEVAGRWGVTHLDDLVWFCSAKGHPNYRKVRLIEHLPRARGVYLFRDDRDRVLYVGKAADLRTRVRSYFGDERRRIDDLLREMSRVDHVVCDSDLEASVLEARMIRRHAPPYNRAQRGRGKLWWLRLTTDRYPRLTRSKNGPGLGPLPARSCEAVREALEAAAEIRTCTQRIGATPSGTACVRGQIGRCPAPCERGVDPEVYAALTEPVARALAGDPGAIVDALTDRLHALSEQQRFEEASSVREHVRALVDAARRLRAMEMIGRAGTLSMVVAGSPVTISDGTLRSVGGRALPVAADGHPDEPRLITAWLARNLHRVQLVRCDGELVEPIRGGRLLSAWAARLAALGRARPTDGNRRRAALVG